MVQWYNSATAFPLEGRVGEQENRRTGEGKMLIK